MSKATADEAKYSPRTVFTRPCVKTIGALIKHDQIAK
jgi:hypothetical protein